MTAEIKNFFDKIGNTEDSFLLLRLYFNPSGVLGYKQDMDEAEEEYFELPNFCDLILNNNLPRFLECALEDENFINKMDHQLYRKLHFFLWDSIEFKKYYKFQNDEDLMKFFKGEITVHTFLEKKDLPKTNGSLFDLLGCYEYYKKYKRLFDHNYYQEKVDGYDESIANNIRDDLNFKIECTLERMEKQRRKEYILEKIEKDDYTGDYDDIYLWSHSIQYSKLDGFKLFDATVCKNKFSEIIEKLVDEGKINGLALDHAIEIIDASVKIKTYAFPNSRDLRIRLGIDLVNDYDLVRAKQLQSDLSLLKRKQENGNSTKIIHLHQKI